MKRRVLRSLLDATILLCLAAAASATCPESPLGLPNVFWEVTDSLSACPAGDSVMFVHSPLHPHPSKLRIKVVYQDADCNARGGVPPESIWVVPSTFSGTAAINDQPDYTGKILADDSTSIEGVTRFTMPSVSGCGKLQFQLYVSGQYEGFKRVVVRTTDSINTDGLRRVTSADQSSPCDVNYNKKPDDGGVVAGHLDHWKRNALHGTLVRRTNYCENCEEGEPNAKGEGPIFWSPSGRFIVHSGFVARSLGGQSDTVCTIFVVPSDPAEGNALTVASRPPYKYHDYNPSWSPLNDVIVFDRADSVVIRRAVPWSGDATETAVTSSNNAGCGQARGDAFSSVSPDGQWVAFSRCNGDPTGGWSLWKVPITGGTPTQLTPIGAPSNQYPSWSPDGQTIYFQRADDAYGPGFKLWKIPAAGGTIQPVFVPPSSPAVVVVQPTLSPDGKILLTGFGPRDDLVRRVITHTLDPTLTFPTSDKLVGNYPDTAFAEKGAEPFLSPRFSPDGTRTALSSKQVWAARRNMSLPPKITAIRRRHPAPQLDYAVADTASTLYLTVSTNSLFYTFQAIASDPESDPITYQGFTFNDPVFSWDAGNNWLIVYTDQIGLHRATLEVTTSSGGTDRITLICDIGPTLSPGHSSEQSSGSAPITLREGPNPTTGRFALLVPETTGIAAELSIFDLRGRLVARIRRPVSAELVWEGRDMRGSLLPPGVYLYRVVAGTYRRDGKVVLMR
jgi:hypothetical protein